MGGATKLLVNGSSFLNNTASIVAGALYLTQTANVVLQYCVLRYQFAPSIAVVSTNSGAALQAVGCDFSYNKASHTGSVAFFLNTESVSALHLVPAKCVRWLNLHL